MEFWARVVDDRYFGYNFEEQVCSRVPYEEPQGALILLRWERERDEIEFDEGGGRGGGGGGWEYDYCDKAVQGFLSRLSEGTQIAAQGRFCVYTRDESGICPPALRGKTGTLQPEGSSRGPINYLALVSFFLPSFFIFLSSFNFRVEVLWI